MGVRSSKSIVNLHPEVLTRIFFHLSPSWLRSARLTCRSFCSASLPLIRTLRTAALRNVVQHQLQALPSITYLTLEVRDCCLSAALATNPRYSARLCHLKLISPPFGCDPVSNISAQLGKDLSYVLTRSPCQELFETGLAAATRLTLTRVTWWTSNYFALS